VAKLKPIDAGYDSGRYSLTFDFEGEDCLSRPVQVTWGKLTVSNKCDGKFIATIDLEYYQPFIAVNFKAGKNVRVKNLLVIPEVMVANESYGIVKLDYN
jgi:hypothetical protein